MRMTVLRAFGNTLADKFECKNQDVLVQLGAWSRDPISIRIEHKAAERLCKLHVTYK